MSQRQPRYVADVLKRLRDWSRAAGKFRRVATPGLARSDAGFDVQVYRHRDVYGREVVTSVAQAKLFRRMVARLLREARQRERQRDWSWFWWLHEYGVLITWDLNDDFEELYTPAIEANFRAAQNRKAATAAAATAKRKKSLRRDQRIEKTKRVPKKKGGREYSPRHVQRLVKKK